MLNTLKRLKKMSRWYYQKLLLLFFFLFFNYVMNNNKKAIIRANNPVASAKAKPNIAYENSWPLNEGFLATPNINAPNTIPIPTPAPAKPIVANPDPIIFAACIILKFKKN